MHFKPERSELSADHLRDVVMRMTQALLSGDNEANLVGQVARELLDTIIAFQRKVIDPMTGLEIGEIGVETSLYLIEVTTKSDGCLQKLLMLKNDPRFNPSRKRVVLYAPYYTPQAAREVVEESIPIIQSLEKLSTYIKKTRTL